MRPVGEVGSFSAKTSRCAPQLWSRARLGGTWPSLRGFRPMPDEMKLTRAAVAVWGARISSQGKVRWGSTRSTGSSRKCPGRGCLGHLHDRHSFTEHSISAHHTTTHDSIQQGVFATVGIIKGVEVDELTATPVHLGAIAERSDRQRERIRAAVFGGRHEHLSRLLPLPG